MTRVMKGLRQKCLRFLVRCHSLCKVRLNSLSFISNCHSRIRLKFAPHRHCRRHCPQSPFSAFAAQIIPNRSTASLSYALIPPARTNLPPQGALADKSLTPNGRPLIGHSGSREFNAFVKVFQTCDGPLGSLFREFSDRLHIFCIRYLKRFKFTSS